jgi:hypothetical protein
MRIRLLSSLALSILAIPVAVSCGGTEEPDTTPPGVGGAGGATGGTGGATGGTAGTGGATGGTAGVGTGGTGGAAGAPTGGVGGATGGAGAGGAGAGMAGSGTAGSGMAGSGTAGSGTGGGGATDSPTDTSQTGLEAFLTAMSHRGADWRANSETPIGEALPHMNNRIFYNRTLRQSAADGKGGTGMPHTTGSMVVKEIYTGTNVIGHAVMLRTATAWIYYCEADEAGRCSSTSMPNQASYAMTATACSCHGAGTIITGETIPAP